MLGLRSQTAQVPSLALPLADWVNRGKLWSFSVPLLPHLDSEGHESSHFPMGAGRIKMPFRVT